VASVCKLRGVKARPKLTNVKRLCISCAPLLRALSDNIITSLNLITVLQLFKLKKLGCKKKFQFKNNIELGDFVAAYIPMQYSYILKSTTCDNKRGIFLGIQFLRTSFPL